MSTLINLNGKIVSPEKALISVFDHGFLFGDSVYEVLVTYRGHLFTLREHLARLRNSAQAIGLKLPLSETGFIREIKKTLQAANNQESYLRIIVTRGRGEINIDPVSCKKREWLIIVKEFKGYPLKCYQKGINLALVCTRRNSPQTVNPAIKTGNYLNSILAMIEAKKKNCADALMLNSSGFITECTTSNFFLVRNELLLTPGLDCGILEGVTRRIIINLARNNGIGVRECRIAPQEIKFAAEMFISSTTRGIMPVEKCDNRTIGAGGPGSLTLRLMKLYREKLEELVKKDRQ